MRNFLSFILITVVCGCISFKEPLPTTAEIMSNYDVNGIKSTECTYRIQEQQPINVYADGKKAELMFNTDWFIVHKDWLKTFNENQDYIINNIQSVTKTKVNIPLIIVFVLIFMFFVLLTIKVIFNGKGKQ